MLRCVETRKEGRIIKAYKVVNIDSREEFWLNKNEMITQIQNFNVDNASIQWWQGSPIIRIKEAKGKKWSPIESERKANIKSENKPVSGEKAVEALKNADNGTPVVVIIRERPKQAILLGRITTERGQDGTEFFDDNGITGKMIFSDKFVKECKSDKLAFIVGGTIEDKFEELYTELTRQFNRK